MGNLSLAAKLRVRKDFRRFFMVKESEEIFGLVKPYPDLGRCSLSIVDCYWPWARRRSELLFVAEFIANSPNGQNHLRIFRVLFDLGSQPVDV